MSGAGPGAAVAGGRRELTLLVEGSVDVYDAAARLESGGYGDAVAVRRGYTDVFDHARALDRGAPAAPPLLGLSLSGGGTGAVTEDEVRAARAGTWARAVLLLASVLMCLPVLPRSGVDAMFVAASAGWLAAQASSAALYWGLGRRDAARGARLALTCLVPMLTASVAVAVVTAWWEVPVWMLAGLAAAYANTVHAEIRRALLILLGSVVCVLAGGDAGRVAAGVLILVFAAWSLWGLARLARGGGRASARGWSLVAWSLLGALGLQGVLLLLLRDPHVSFPVVALAGTAAGVLGGPLLDGCVRYLRRLTDGATNWRRARGRMFATALVFSAELGALSALMSDVVALIFIHRQVTLVEGAAAFLVGALSAAGGILMRVGTARGSALTLVASALTLWLVQSTVTLAGAWAVVALLSISVVAAVVAAARLARPGWW